MTKKEKVKNMLMGLVLVAMKFIDFRVLVYVALMKIAAIVLDVVERKMKYISGKIQILLTSGRRKTKKN